MPPPTFTPSCFMVAGAAAIPAGFTADGLPLGVQLMGNANSEPLLFAVSAQLEQELRWADARPARWW